MSDVGSNSIIPELKITEVHYEDGWIERVRLDDGQEIPVSAAIILIESGVIPGYTIGNRDGRPYIRANIDQDWENNLERFPRF